MTFFLLVLSQHIQGDTFPVIWVDNFSKNLARHIPSVTKGVFTSMMWTGLACKLYDGPPVSRNLVYVGGHLLPAMPPEHAPNLATTIRAAQASLDYVPGQPPIRFLSSLVCRHKVYSIPPKISPSLQNDIERQRRLLVSRDGLHRTLPWDIWKHNIGSNTGLIDVIRQYVDTAQLEESTKYHVWLVDVNIYNRVYKVICCLCGCFRNLVVV